MNNKEQNKILCERYPFLIHRNTLTGKIDNDYDYSYIVEFAELPYGWYNLFLQLCEDIRQPLIDAGYLNEFRFLQVKEKFDSMRCYTWNAPKTVHDIIEKYEYISYFICQRCGKPATYQTTGWMTSYCDDCITNTDKKHAKPIEFNPIFKIHRSDKNGTTIMERDVSNEWDRLYE